MCRQPTAAVILLVDDAPFLTNQRRRLFPDTRILASCIFHILSYLFLRLRNMNFSDSSNLSLVDDAHFLTNQGRRCFPDAHFLQVSLQEVFQLKFLATLNTSQTFTENKQQSKCKQTAERSKYLFTFDLYVHECRHET